MSTPQAYLVDDDEAIRDALSWLLKSRGLPCTAFDSAESFLAAWHKGMSGCVVLDMRMSGMSGLDCFDQLGERQSTLPVIFLTGHGDVPLAVATLKKGRSIFLKSRSTTTNWPPASRKPWRSMPGNAPQMLRSIR